MQEFETGVSLEMYLLAFNIRWDCKNPTTCLVCVMPVFRISFRYFITSFTGSTGGLHDMKITAERLDKIVSSYKLSYRMACSSGSSLSWSLAMSIQSSCQEHTYRISALSLDA